MAFPSQMAPGAEELFGATRKQVVVIREPGDGAKWSGVAVGFGDSTDYQELVGTGDFAEHRVFPAYYLQTLLPSTARATLMAGHDVAGCVHSYGKGQAYLVGTLLGHAVLSYNDHHNESFLAAALRRAGVLPDQLGRLQRRQRRSGKKTAWFVFNTTSEPIEETVSVASIKPPMDLLGAELKLKEGTAAIRVDPMEIRCIILEN